MWMDFGCETSLVPEMPETSQHFFYDVIRPGLADKRKRGKSFSIFLRITRLRSPPRPTEWQAQTAVF